MSNQFNFNMSQAADYLTDDEAEKNGVKLQFGNGLWFQCRRAGGSNEDFTNALRRLMKPYRRNGKMMDIPQAASENIMRQVYAETVITDWSVIDENGDNIDPTIPAIKAYLKMVPDLFNDIVELASAATTYQLAEVEEANEVLGET